MSMQSTWHQAAIDGDVAVVAGLIRNGHDLDRLDRYGQTAIMLASVHGRGDVVNLLIQRNANLDVTAKHGLGALMLAIINGHADIAMALMKAGADPNLRGSGAPGFAGKTASDLAVERGLKELVEAIQRSQP
jgi:ankyrin repeat protein